MAVIIETSVGELTVDLYTEERPRCAKNFLKLCKVKYYNFCLFHSVQQNLVAQTGDPTATGRGGMSVYGMVYGEQARFFDMELTPRIKHRKRGQLSMVNNGNGKHGSQFFITLGTDLDYLDGEHTVFGEVAEGLEVLDKLNEAYCDENHRPYRDIRIFHTVILDDPFDDPEGLAIPDKSPEPTKEMLESDRIGVDEEVDDTKGMTEQEVEELHAAREAKANAQLLEMVGDIPDTDVKPPDNVLFVCKLNPVTTEEDLETIFSRFGPILSCEVIKDHKTKESLQYAFIEFEEPEHCENAYFKMDNVLIDDRRIHVDFSQSVSKLRLPASGKVEEKKEDQPRYILKDRQRRDNNYDLVFEHDLTDASTETKRSSQPKHHKHADSQDADVRERKKKKADRRSRSRSRDAEGRERRKSLSPQQERRKGTRRDRKTSSSDEDSRRERRKERRSPSSEEDRRRERKKKARSPSLEEDRRKERRKKNRSPSSEEDRRKERRNKARSPSSEEEEHRQKQKERRALSPEEDREKKKRRRRSPSLEEKGRKEKNKRERSRSPEEDRRKKKKKEKKSKRRSSSSSEEDRGKERKREEGRRDHSSSSHRDRDRR